MAKNDNKSKKSAKSAGKPAKPAVKKAKKQAAPAELTVEQIDKLEDAEKVAELLDARGVKFDPAADLAALKDLLRKDVSPDESGDDDEDADDEGADDSDDADEDSDDDDESDAGDSDDEADVDSDDDEDTDEDAPEEKPAKPVSQVLGKTVAPRQKFDAPRGLADVVVPKELKGAVVIAVVDGNGSEIRSYSAKRHGADFRKLAVMFAGKQPGRKAVLVK